MYRQILVHPDDQDYQRILWRNNTTDDVEEWCLKTVTYGMAAAPYLAIRAMRQLAHIERENFPVASKVALSDFYVDDLITGCDAIQMQKDLMEMLVRGGFELRKWSSNIPMVLEHVPPEHRESQSPLAMTDEEAVGT